MALIIGALIGLAFGIGFIVGMWWTDQDNRRWPKRYGWCPECGRDVDLVVGETR